MALLVLGFASADNCRGFLSFTDADNGDSNMGACQGDGFNGKANMNQLDSDVASLNAGEQKAKCCAEDSNKVLVDVMRLRIASTEKELNAAQKARAETRAQCDATKAEQEQAEERHHEVIEQYQAGYDAANSAMQKAQRAANEAARRQSQADLNCNNLRRIASAVRGAFSASRTKASSQLQKVSKALNSVQQTHRDQRGVAQSFLQVNDDLSTADSAANSYESSSGALVSILEDIKSKTENEMSEDTKTSVRTNGELDMAIQQCGSDGNDYGQQAAARREEVGRQGESAALAKSDQSDEQAELDGLSKEQDFRHKDCNAEDHAFGKRIEMGETTMAELNKGLSIIQNGPEAAAFVQVSSTPARALSLLSDMAKGSDMPDVQALVQTAKESSVSGVLSTIMRLKEDIEKKITEMNKQNAFCKQQMNNNQHALKQYTNQADQSKEKISSAEQRRAKADDKFAAKKAELEAAQEKRQNESKAHAKGVADLTQTITETADLVATVEAGLKNLGSSEALQQIFTTFVNDQKADQKEAEDLRDEMNGNEEKSKSEHEIVTATLQAEKEVAKKRGGAATTQASSEKTRLETIMKNVQEQEGVRQKLQPLCSTPVVDHEQQMAKMQAEIDTCQTALAILEDDVQGVGR